MTVTLPDSVVKRFEDQLSYFEAKATQNQQRYVLMRRLMLIASWLTPLAIFGLILLPQESRDWWSVVPMLLSTVAVGSYQWEEQHNYGAQWSKFRLVAESLKRHRSLWDASAGPFRGLEDGEKIRAFVEVIEKIIEGTDINYFTLMVDPAKGPDSK